jgi:hypothetical protein
MAHRKGCFHGGTWSAEGDAGEGPVQWALAPVVGSWTIVG